jgi:phosphatidate cytidylyltransferase
MNERDSDPPPRPANEGVRIIGADEAQAAVEGGQSAQRRSRDELRPAPAPGAGLDPRASVAFPLARGEDAPAAPRRAASVWASNPGGRPDGGGADVTEGFRPLGEDATIDVGPPTGPVALPDWTDPPTGQVPRVILGEEEADEAWASRSGRQPRWRDEGDDWEENATHDPLLADDGTRVGALDSGRGDMSDLYSFDDPVTLATPEPQPEPPPAPAPIRTNQRPGGEVPPYSNGNGGARDVPMAALVGGGIGVLALLAAVAGSGAFFLLAFLVVMGCAVEAFGVFQRAGYKPATLLGLTAVASLMLSAYFKGVAALPLVVALTLIATMLWYLAKVVRARPVLAIATTMLGVVWVGVLGSYAALMLNTRFQSHAHKNLGVVVVMAAVLPTVTYDVAGFFGGTAFGTRPIAPDVSPNKTVEGTVVGMAAAFIMACVWSVAAKSWGLGHGIVLGVVVAIAAPLGDLCQSMIKRDIGVKDMGGILPGHGGLLDRFDSLLFVLPAVYYLAHYYNLVF